MKYYLTCKLRISKTYVMNKDGQWVDLGENNPKDFVGLKTFSSYDQAKNSIKGQMFTVFDKQVEAFGSSWTLGEPIIGVESYRTDKPVMPYFTIDDIRVLIANGDDSNHNRIVVDEDGKLHLIADDFGLKYYPVTNSEIFQAGNGYVGVQASEDEQFIMNEYSRMLEAWHSHIKSGGKTTSSEDYYHTVDTVKLVREITEIIDQEYN